MKWKVMLLKSIIVFFLFVSIFMYAFGYFVYSSQLKANEHGYNEKVILYNREKQLLLQEFNILANSKTDKTSNINSLKNSVVQTKSVVQIQKQSNSVSQLQPVTQSQPQTIPQPTVVRMTRTS